MAEITNKISSTGSNCTQGIRSYRVRGTTVALVCWAVMICAWAGVQNRLPMPDCSFLIHTGYPCPSCGMTRSITAIAKGRIVEAFNFHPFGVILLAAIAVVAIVASAEALTGKNLISLLRPSLRWVWIALICMLAGWAWVLVTGLASGRLPIH